MRTAKFNVPVEVLIDFLDAVVDEALISQVVSRTDDDYQIEVDYDKEEATSIDILEEELLTLVETLEEGEEEETED
jgi:hypothetical protein